MVGMAAGGEEDDGAGDGGSLADSSVGVHAVLWARATSKSAARVE
jgi:hypothetical protein